MRKILGGLTVLLIVGLVLAGCSNPTGGGSGAAGPANPLGRYAAITFTDFDKTQASATLVPIENYTRNTALTTYKIASHAQSGNVEGVWFAWDQIQQGAGYVKVDATVYAKYDGFFLTAKIANQYFDFWIAPQEGQKSYVDSTGNSYYLFLVDNQALMAGLKSNNGNGNNTFNINWVILSSFTSLRKDVTNLQGAADEKSIGIIEFRKVVYGAYDTSGAPVGDPLPWSKWGTDAKAFAFAVRDGDTLAPVVFKNVPANASWTDNNKVVFLVPTAPPNPDTDTYGIIHYESTDILPNHLYLITEQAGDSNAAKNYVIGKTLYDLDGNISNGIISGEEKTVTVVSAAGDQTGAAKQPTYLVDPSNSYIYNATYPGNTNPPIKQMWSDTIAASNPASYGTMMGIKTSGNKAAQWIWDSPDSWNNIQYGSEILYSKTFTINGDVQDATVPIYFACDNAVIVYVDGQYVGCTEGAFNGMDTSFETKGPPPDFRFKDLSYDTFSGDYWMNMYPVSDIKSYLTPGPHTIAFYAANSFYTTAQVDSLGKYGVDTNGASYFDNPAGLIFASQFTTYLKPVVGNFANMKVMKQSSLGSLLGEGMAGTLGSSAFTSTGVVNGQVAFVKDDIHDIDVAVYRRADGDASNNDMFVLLPKGVEEVTVPLIIYTGHMDQVLGDVTIKNTGTGIEVTYEFYNYDQLTAGYIITDNTLKVKTGCFTSAKQLSDLKIGQGQMLVSGYSYGGPVPVPSVWKTGNTTNQGYTADGDNYVYVLIN